MSSITTRNAAGWSFPGKAGLVVACLLLPASGCADGRPARVPVSGIVTIDGEPLTNGTIRFVPEVGRAAIGSIDTQGRFSLTCYELDDGVPPGVHRVSITATEPVGDKVRWHAPKKYSNHKTSGLTQQIDAAVDNLQIEITWDGGKPFVSS